jgi:hypothetical protein
VDLFGSVLRYDISVALYLNVEIGGGGMIGWEQFWEQFFRSFRRAFWFVFWGGLILAIVGALL